MDWPTRARVRTLALGSAAIQPSTPGQVASILGANNVDGITLQRYTDSAPTGNFLVFKNAAAAALFRVNIAGEVDAGSWKGTAVAAAYGGTGQTTYAVGDLLYASAATTLSKLAAVAVGQVLISKGVTTAAAWSGSIGLGEAAPATSGLYVATLGTNNVTGFRLRRFTDSAPTGTFIECQNAVAGVLFSVSIAGAVTAKGPLTLTGVTSGSVALAVPAVAGTNTATFPAKTGTVSLSQGYYDVKVDFGAVGDGTTDDGPAFQAAFDALATARGGTLHVPPGTFKIATQVAKDFVVNDAGGTSAIVIEGEGSASIIYFQTANTDYGWYIRNLDQLTLRDLTFRGHTTAAQQDGLIPLYLRNIIQCCTLEGCLFYGLMSTASGGSVLDCYGSGDVVILQTRFLGCGGAASPNYTPVVRLSYLQSAHFEDVKFMDYGYLNGTRYQKTPYTWLKVDAVYGGDGTIPDRNRTFYFRSIYMDEAPSPGMIIQAGTSPHLTDVVFEDIFHLVSSTTSAVGVQFKYIDRLFVRNYKAVCSGTSVHNKAVELTSVGHAILEHCQFTNYADTITADSGCTTLEIRDSEYTTLTSSATTTRTLKDGLANELKANVVIGVNSAGSAASTVPGNTTVIADNGHVLLSIVGTGGYGRIYWYWSTTQIAQIAATNGSGTPTLDLQVGGASIALLSSSGLAVKTSAHLNYDGTTFSIYAFATVYKPLEIDGGYIRLNKNAAFGVVVGAPTGLDKGTGSINAVTVWRNGTSLDRVFEADYALLPIPQMRAHYERYRTLPTIPREVHDDGSINMGSLTDGLWETAEVHARYIAELHDRIASLEADVTALLGEEDR